MPVTNLYSSLIPNCPLCHFSSTEVYHQDKKRSYYHCPQCQLVFVPPQFQLTPEQEKKEYDLHDNQIYDPRYRRFLSRLATPLLERLHRPSEGLDFGCGPGPALASMLDEKGHKVHLYDPFYHNTPEVLDWTYDFISATEVVEHLKHPARELSRLLGLLRPGGILALMTKLVTNQKAFSTWHYIQDPTHICFYSHDTMKYIADKFSCHLEIIDRDVIFLRPLASPRLI